MNIFFYELKAYRNSTAAWILSLLLMTILFFSFFPSVAKEADKFQLLMAGFPEGVRLALGLSVENIGEILGYYSYILLYILLVGAIQAMILGTSVISREIRHKTADFLLSKPILRTRIMTAKLLAAFSLLVITNIFYLIGSFIIASLVKTKEYSVTVFLLLSLTLFFIQLIFLALGVLVSVSVFKLKSVIPVSLGTVFTLFIIGALASATGDDALRYLSPFKYFNFFYIMQHSSYEASFLVIAFGIITVAITAGYILYCRRDIPVL